MLPTTLLIQTLTTLPSSISTSTSNSNSTSTSTPTLSPIPDIDPTYPDHNVDKFILDAILMIPCGMLIVLCFACLAYAASIIWNRIRNRNSTQQYQNVNDDMNVNGDGDGDRVVDNSVEEVRIELQNMRQKVRDLEQKLEDADPPPVYQSK